MKDKDQSIETLRGIAIVLVVAGYIIQDDLNQIHSGITAFLDWMYYLLKPVRMPLFTVISAYLYASSPATQATFKKLVTGKARRILIPYFVVSTMQYIFYSVFQVQGLHPIHGIFKIYLWPFEQFWFLWAIFWIFMAVGLLDSVKMLDTKSKWLGWLALSIIVYIPIELPRFLAARGIVYLMPFFLMGYGIRRFSKDLFTPKMIKAYVAAASIGYAVYLGIYEKIPFETPAFKILTLWVSLTAVPLIFHFRRTIPLLARIGSYAFGIYIFNKISSALPRMAFEHFGIDNEILIMAVYLGCGIGLSIGIQIILEQFNVTRRFILGMSDIPKSVPTEIAPTPALPVPQPAAPAAQMANEPPPQFSSQGKA